MTIFVQYVGWPWGVGTEINAVIPTIVATQTAKGRKCFAVDMRSECPITQGETSDGTHPTDGGYVKMATVWFNHLKPYLSGSMVVDTFPKIVTEPASKTVFEGQTATFRIAAAGKQPLQYQWRKNGTALSGKTADSLTIITAMTDSGGVYSCIVKNTLGADTSANAILTVKSMAGNALNPGTDADAGTRHTKIAWWADADNSWSNPSTFGTVVLKAPTAVKNRPAAAVIPTVRAVLTSSIHGRLISVNLGNSGPARVEITQLQGKTVFNAMVTGNSHCRGIKHA